MILIEDDQMIETFSADTSNYSFRVRIWLHHQMHLKRTIHTEVSESFIFPSTHQPRVRVGNLPSQLGRRSRLFPRSGWKTIRHPGFLDRSDCRGSFCRHRGWSIFVPAR